jgi:Lon protease-like protein
LLHPNSGWGRFFLELPLLFVLELPLLFDLPPPSLPFRDLMVLPVLKTLPESIPVMVLSGCTHFPQSVMPLFIFEPRYRQMLAHALEKDRLFCVANRLPNLESQPWDDEDSRRISPVFTVGLVRACVQNEDGTSRLMLLGLQRVKLVKWVQEAPFRIAKVEPLETDVNAACAEKASALRNLVESKLGDPELMADFVAANFIRDGEVRQTVLESADLETRLSCLTRCLGD